MKILDIEKLKGITEYYSCHKDSKVVKWFWEILADASQEDQTLYLKFAWGRSRLPYDCSKLKYKHTICLMSYWQKDQLPESHTCFFQTDFPEYEDKETMERKFLTAIRFCGEIDND